MEIPTTALGGLQNFVSMDMAAFWPVGCLMIPRMRTVPPPHSTSYAQGCYPSPHHLHFLLTCLTFRLICIQFKCYPQIPYHRNHLGGSYRLTVWNSWPPLNWAYVWKPRRATSFDSATRNPHPAPCGMRDAGCGMRSSASRIPQSQLLYKL